MVPAAEAIRGQRSAHSLATGPVMAEPFISPLMLTITPALSTNVKRKHRTNSRWSVICHSWVIAVVEKVRTRMHGFAKRNWLSPERCLNEVRHRGTLRFKEVMHHGQGNKGVWHELTLKKRKWIKHGLPSKYKKVPSLRRQDLR